MAPTCFVQAAEDLNGRTAKAAPPPPFLPPVPEPTVTIAEQKAALRKRFAATTSRPDAEEGERLRDLFLERFAAKLADVTPREFSGFWPLEGEIDVRPLMTTLQARGWACALPVVMGRGRPLAFRRWRDGDPLEARPFGLREPAPGAPEATPRLVLVPMVAFDAAGTRLGHGAGYYDMTLAALRAAGPVMAVGVARDAQEAESLPRAPHDERLDALVTPTRVMVFSRCEGEGT